MTTPSLPQSTRLSFSGKTAELSRDTLTDSGVVLSIGGAEQSHVEVADPSFLLHDYIRRMRAVLSNTLTAAPATALHLGAGAMTLPRWLQQRWPEIAQTVLDIEPELVDFVLEHLPLEPRPENIVADAAVATAPDGVLSGRRFDVVVIDLFNSAQAPETITSAEFFAQVMQLLTPGGKMLMNFGDEADMSFARRLVGRLLQAVESRGFSSGQALLSAPDAVLGAAEEGNLVFAVAAEHAFTEAELSRIWAAGPHPGEVLTGPELQQWCQ